MRYANSSEYLNHYRQNPQCFGSALLRGNPKGPRPFSSAQALHLVLRSSLAQGSKSLLRGNRKQEIQHLLIKQAKRFQVVLYSYANSGNHLHILVRPSRKRTDFIAFLRAISGLIARKILKGERGRPAKQKFWNHRPFTRIVDWGKEFQRCARYIEKNIFEAQGIDALVDYREQNVFIKARLRAPPSPC